MSTHQYTEAERAADFADSEARAKSDRAELAAQREQEAIDRRAAEVVVAKQREDLYLAVQTVIELVRAITLSPHQGGIELGRAFCRARMSGGGDAIVTLAETAGVFCATNPWGT